MRSGTEVDDDPTVGDPEVVAPIEVHIADFVTDLRNMKTRRTRSAPTAPTWSPSPSTSTAT
ncbi:hypothetical protein AB0L57_19920 [Nocardia sp. NPDC052254]|uniref:hypothetical protein n=1 Tax=Nocardia sp. NPDC052254 TaxID=3155681 RepID=UPI0034393EBD